ncbi:MAG: polyprenyl synthetase family protein [Desulfosarcina sp.]|nr:polyprenyl synthetase family protein [Desulfosarcina sp.]
MSIDDNLSDPIAQMERVPLLAALMAELKSGILIYWEAADQILRQCGVSLKAPTEATFSLQKNLFSLLFLYSYQRAGIARSRRILYAATLQCLRGMVTGCDNLLDDEYKQTLDTDIPATGYRFRSVMDIMISDRVLFQILMDAATRQEIASDRVLAAATASMKTMTRSGVEEAAEEAGIAAILKPEEILQSIHHFKTGILFQCPWDIPLTIETADDKNLAPLLEGLYRIGIGCQIMDDIVDMVGDIEARRHNYVVSLIHHGPNPLEKDRLSKMMNLKSIGNGGPFYGNRFPEAIRQALEISHRLLTDGLKTLFSTEHQALVSPAIRFLQERIGVLHLIKEAEL